MRIDNPGPTKLRATSFSPRNTGVCTLTNKLTLRCSHYLWAKGKGTPLRIMLCELASNERDLALANSMRIPAVPLILETR